MSLARAITKRMRRGDDASSSRFGRNNTVRHAPIAHGTISSPLALLSTTNVHALSAPDLPKNSSNSSSSSSTHSTSDSDFSSMIDRSFQIINGEMNSTPVTPITPPMEIGKGFFEPTVSEIVPEVPQLPQRCPSHSKKAHVELSRKRSIQRMSPPPTSLTRAASVRDSAAMFSASIQEEVAATESQAHPFGAELAKVNELAEDFGASNVMIDEEERFMASQGLCKFNVQEYIEEIAGLYGGIYENNLGMAANPWL